MIVTEKIHLFGSGLEMLHFYTTEGEHSKARELVRALNQLQHDEIMNKRLYGVTKHETA